MNDLQENLADEGLVSLAIDPDVLAKELEAELLGDPLEEIELDDSNEDVISMKDNLKDGLKYYRYKKRFSFLTSDNLYRIDITGFNEKRIITPSDAGDPAWSPILQ